MERVELKELLKSMGIDEKLVEMPAIIEPIYKEVMDKTVNQVRKSGIIAVQEPDKFLFDKKSITLEKDGGASVDYDDVSIRINSYGIQTSYSDGNEYDFFSSIIRKVDGTIESTSGNNGNGSWGENVYLDNGSWSIKNACGESISTRSSIRYGVERPVELDKKSSLEEFDTNSKSIIQNYPATAEWYAKRREALEATIERETDPVLLEKRRVEALEAEVKRLTAVNRDLTNRNEKLSSMLNRSLEFMSEVRKSPVGQIFFHRKLKKYDENAKSLDSGREMYD